MEIDYIDVLREKMNRLAKMIEEKEDVSQFFSEDERNEISQSYYLLLQVSQTFRELYDNNQNEKEKSFLKSLWFDAENFKNKIAEKIVDIKITL